MKFTIETVSKMTGIPAVSLRNWEKRYGFPCPERTPGGHRYYSAQDVEFLKKANAWVEEGQSLNEISRIYLSKRSEVHSESAVETAKTVILDDVTYRVELIYEALLNFDQMATLQHYATLSAKLSVEQLFDQVFGALQWRLRKEWSEKKITLAQEHFASAFVRLKLSTFLSLDFPPTQGTRILASPLTEEGHESGLMVLTAHLKYRGYPVFYFGTDVPIGDLKSVVEEIRPDVVCLSYADCSRVKEDLKYFSEIPVPICIGGLLGSVGEIKSLQSLASKNIYFCQKPTGAESAQFVEMICQSKSRRQQSE
jgi:DNA-binding transcriptional MerR regulator